MTSRNSNLGSFAYMSDSDHPIRQSELESFKLGVFSKYFVSRATVKKPEKQGKYKRGRTSQHTSLQWRQTPAGYQLLTLDERKGRNNPKKEQIKENQAHPGCSRSKDKKDTNHYGFVVWQRIKKMPRYCSSTC